VIENDKLLYFYVGSYSKSVIITRDIGGNKSNKFHIQVKK